MSIIESGDYPQIDRMRYQTKPSPSTIEKHHPRDLRRLDGFDCVLPDGALNELLAPKRARMLGRPVQGRMPRRWLKSLLRFVAIIMTPVAAFALLVGIITPCGIGTHSQAPGRDVLLGRTFHPMPMPAPTPVVQPPVVQTPAPRMPEVRRDELVPVTVQRATLRRLPVPRAILWKLPEWRIGERRGMLMPYGLEVVGQLKGRVDDEGLLPVDGNNIGDVWLVGTTPWIWLTTPGLSQPSWVDP